MDQSSQILTPLGINRLVHRLDFLVRSRLWAQILIAMILGISIGLVLSPSGGALVEESTAHLHAKPLLDLCVSIQDVSMKVVSWAMVIAPLAVFGLLAQISIEAGLNALLGMTAYVGTVLLGLLLLLFILSCHRCDCRTP